MRGAFVVSGEAPASPQCTPLLRRPPYTARNASEVDQHILTCHQLQQTLLVPNPRQPERVAHRRLLAAVVPRMRLLEHEDRALVISHPNSMRRPTDRATPTTYP